MNGDKQVRLIPVGDIRSLVQFDEDIRFACINDFHIIMLFRYQATEPKSYRQINSLFIDGRTTRTRVFPPMPGIDHHRKRLFLCLRHR